MDRNPAFSGAFGGKLEPLLDYYSRVDSQAVSVQAAVLEEVTYLKVIGTGTQQAYTGTKRIAKGFFDRIGIHNSIDDTPAKSIAELVLQRAENWSHRGKAAREFVVCTLASRLGIPSTDNGTLSTRLIEEAAAGYDISSDLLLSQQAEAVAAKYLEDCVKGLQEQLKKQDPTQVRITEQLIAKQIAAMTPEERLEIQKALNLQTLSASSLRSAVLSTGLPIAGMVAVQAGGFGAYLALTTVMHAVFTSMLGITLPFAAYTGATSALSFLTGPFGVMLSLSIGLLGYFWGQRKIQRSQYAMIVWTCVLHAGQSLVPSTASLPSARVHRLLSDSKNGVTEVPSSEELDFSALQLERQTQICTSTELSQAQKSADQALHRVQSLEERLRRAEASLASALASQHNEQQLNSALQSLINKQQSAIRELNVELENARKSDDQLKAHLEKRKRDFTEAEMRFVSRRERRAKELQSLWAIHFPKIDFHQQPLRWCAEQDFSGRLEVERALKELADAPDPVKLSRSRMHDSHEHHSRFTIPKGVECRLFYTVSNGRISIRRMCKKKDC